MTSGRKTCYGLGLLIFLSYLLWLTLNPFEFSQVWFRKFTHWGAADAFWRTYQFKGYDLIGNVLLFIPFGFLLQRIQNWPERKAWLRALMVGAGLSLVIESVQLVLPRSTSLFDIATNGLGAGIGAFWASLRQPGGATLKKSLRRLAWFWAAAVTVLALAPTQMSHVNGWDDHFPLLLGDEADGGRIWSGRLAMAALYDTPLSGREAKALMSLPLTADSLRASLGMAVMMRPDSLTALGREAFGDAVLEKHAWRFDGRGARRFPPPVDWISTVRRHRAFSLECWIRTSHFDQTGPARIVTQSVSADERNFTLGQIGGILQFRVRTPLAGPNGSIVRVDTKSVLKPEAWQHVLAVFSAGGAQVYVDGRDAGGRVTPFRDYFSHSILDFGQNGLSQFGAAWALFLPLALAGTALFRKSGWLLILLPPLLLQSYWIAALHLPVDWGFWGQWLAVTAAGGAAGCYLRQCTENMSR